MNLGQKDGLKPTGELIVQGIWSRFQGALGNVLESRELTHRLKLSQVVLMEW